MTGLVVTLQAPHAVTVEVDADDPGEPLVENQRVAAHVDLDLDRPRSREVELHEGVDGGAVALEPHGDGRPVARALVRGRRRLDDHGVARVVDGERHLVEERQGEESVHRAELGREATERDDPDEAVVSRDAAERKGRSRRQGNGDLLARHPAAGEARAVGGAPDLGAEPVGEQRQADAGVEDEARCPVADQHGHGDEVVDPLERRRRHGPTVLRLRWCPAPGAVWRRPGVPPTAPRGTPVSLVSRYREGCDERVPPVCRDCIALRRPAVGLRAWRRRAR